MLGYGSVCTLHANLATGLTAGLLVSLRLHPRPVQGNGGSQGRTTGGGWESHHCARHVSVYLWPSQLSCLSTLLGTLHGAVL